MFSIRVGATPGVMCGKMTKESGYMIGLSTRHLSGGFRTDFHIKLSRIKADLWLSWITWMDPYGTLDDIYEIDMTTEDTTGA